MSETPDVLVRRAPGALWRRVHDEVVATTPSDTDVHRLVGGAGEVWAELTVPSSRDELARRLADRFDVPVEDLHAQVAVCVDELTAIGLIERNEPADV